MKKILSIFMSTIMIVLMITPLISFAGTPTNAYTYSTGETVEYYIDLEGHEYVYKNGQKTYVLLPLEKYRVTDEAVLEAINFESTQEYTDISSENIKRSPAPIIISTLYKKNTTLPIVTGYMNYPAKADYLRLKTTDCKPFLKSKKVNVHIYVRASDDGSIYDYHYFDQNCTSSKPYELSGRFASQVNISVVSFHEMTSCTFAVTATLG